jgi:hypothetical protein
MCCNRCVHGAQEYCVHDERATLCLFQLAVVRLADLFTYCDVVTRDQPGEAGQRRAKSAHGRQRVLEKKNIKVPWPARMRPAKRSRTILRTGVAVTFLSWQILRAWEQPPGRVGFANSLLEGFKSNFVSLEGDFVKNRYVEMLGLHALAIGTLFRLPYVILDLFRTHHGFFHTYKSFLLLAAAACAGTWLSFSLRRVTLGFTDLANLEEDRLAPTMRLLFVIGLTWVIALFIAARIIDFKIGEVPPQRFPGQCRHRQSK